MTTALVIGGSMAGLLAARVLSDQSSAMPVSTANSSEC